MSNIELNFLPFVNQNFSVTVYRKKILSETDTYEDVLVYRLPNDKSEEFAQYSVSLTPKEGFAEYKADIKKFHSLVAYKIHDRLLQSALLLPSYMELSGKVHRRRIHFSINNTNKGAGCVWIQPHYLHIQRIWGVLVGYHFIVKEDPVTGQPYPLDKEILISSGTLNSKGLSNPDFYLFKYGTIDFFIKEILPSLNNNLQIKIRSEFSEFTGYSLRQKEYIFGNNSTSASPFFGLSKNPPLQQVSGNYRFQFIYRPKDREYAVQLLKGLRGETFPSTFSGMDKFFKVNFGNELIKGTQVESFSNNELDKLVSEITQTSSLILPVLIISRDEDQLYYQIKSKFTNALVPCQVVTRELTSNQNSLKYSLGNIALQMFAKLGGKPWKMKPAGNDYLIIGIGQSYNKEVTEEGNVIEKNISYSILTDSSGIFKDLQVLGEGFEADDSYWNDLVGNLVMIINGSQSNKIAIHVPFRISKKRVLDKVASQIRSGVELSVLVINDKNDYFGFDTSNNGLVPFESTFIKVSPSEYLIWFEGMQAGNPKIMKRFANPLLVKLWYCNFPDLMEQQSYRQVLLQDCINLSGANWRGFRAKQLPVSIYYCQRIAEFISKFREYHLDHININNLKPWFL